MSIFINGTELKSVEALPDNIQTILVSIPQGLPWVTKMLTDKSNRLDFSSIENFIEQINVGLRGTSLVHFQNLDVTVDVKKLLEMSTDDLRDMLYFTASSSSNGGLKTADLLGKHGLIGSDAFNKVVSFLQQHGHANLPCQWRATFSEYLTFYQVIQYCSAQFHFGDHVLEQALSWAASKAQTLSELGHYYCLYLLWVEHTDGRGVEIEDLLNQLTPLVLEHLDCPVVTCELDQTLLKGAITQWNDMGRVLGFTNFSTGLLNLVMNIDLQQKGEQGKYEQKKDAIKAQASKYITQLQSQLSTHLATDSFIQQAGQYRHYFFELGDKTVVLNLDDAGCLSIYGDLLVA